MKFLGIKFAPLFVPLHRRLETLSVALIFNIITLGPFIIIATTIYILFYTRFWPLMLIYLLWIFSDRKTCEQGGRPVHWIRNLNFWQHATNYFPLSYKSVEGFQLNPKKNYLFCAFPHAIFPIGSLITTVNVNSEFAKMNSQFRSYSVTLTSLFHYPFYRELFLAIGAISASKESLLHILNKPKGGHCVGLIPGGADEAFDAKPGQHKLNLKKRKGFIKLALMTGTSLIPNYSFGEIEVFKQVDNVLLKKCQGTFYRLTGYAMVIAKGRGFFQYSFGLIPHRKRIVLLSGKPIDVEKVENPTQEQIDNLHAKFIEELVKLFEENKKFYIENSENIHIQF